MIDNQGPTPADQTPDTPAEAQVPAVPTTSAADAVAPAETPAPAAPPVAETPAPAPAAPAAPAAAEPTAAPAAPAATTAPAPTAPATAPAAAAPVPPRPAPPAGFPAGGHAYQAPYGYAGQPQAAPAPGAAFGIPADTHPTLPITGAVPTGAATVKEKKKSGAGKVAGLLVAAALVGGAAGLGGTYAGIQLFSTSTASTASGPSTITVNDTESVTQTTAIAATVLPSVVTIEAASDSGSGTGSGVILTDDGYVVTNTHVVTLDGATGDATVRVTTSDGRVFDAEVVGTDPTYDLAVIKLEDAEDLTPIEFADSSDLNVGDQAVAVGAPLGLANTVTTGIVSALNRSIEIASSAAPGSGDATEDDGSGDEEQQEGGQGGPFFFDFGQGDTQQQATETIKIAVIQTDAAINPGNSGGALVDSDGKLIGINVAIASAGSSSGTAGSIGVGFSIPSNIVQRVTSEIIEDGSATHGLLGANVMSAAYVEGSTITGAYIDDVVDGGAAASAGLRKGDVVTEFNGAPITDSVDLTAQVRAAAAGSTAELTYVRDGTSHTVEVTLGELP